MLSGCATLTVVPAERRADQRLTPGAVPVAHIYAANWGVYLFKHLPLITGSLSRPGVPSWPALFRDDVQVDRLVQKVSEQSKAAGRNGTDRPPDSRPIVLYAWSLFLWLNEFEVSANASRARCTSPGLAGTSWRLVKFQGSDDTTLTPDDKGKYTIAFNKDGSLTARIDCNRGRGTWKSSGPNQVQLGPLALTRALAVVLLCAAFLAGCASAHVG